MLIPKSTLRTIGLLPEEYFMGVEDVDYCLAARKHHLNIAVVPGSLIWHKIGGSRSHNENKGNTLNPLAAYHQYRGWQILRKKYLPFPLYILTTLTSTGCAAWRLVTHLPSHPLTTLKASLQGLKGIQRGIQEANKS
jgi:GT2 family glycosyltransferase